MNCQKMDSIESLCHFLRSESSEKRSNLAVLLFFANLIKNGQITFLYFLHTASWG